MSQRRRNSLATVLFGSNAGSRLGSVLLVSQRRRNRLATVRFFGSDVARKNCWPMIDVGRYL